MSEIDESLHALREYGAAQLRPALAQRVLAGAGNANLRFAWGRSTLYTAAICGLACGLLLVSSQQGPREQDLSPWQDLVETTQEIDGGF